MIIKNGMLRLSFSMRSWAVKPIRCFQALQRFQHAAETLYPFHLMVSKTLDKNLTHSHTCFHPKISPGISCVYQSLVVRMENHYAIRAFQPLAKNHITVFPGLGRDHQFMWFIPVALSPRRENPKNGWSLPGSFRLVITKISYKVRFFQEHRINN